MALEAATLRSPTTIAPSVPVTGLVIEDSLTTEQFLLPSLLFVNTHPTVDVIITVTRRIDLGISADPEDDGIIDTVLVNAQTLSANGGELVVDLGLQALVQANTTPSIKHLVDMSHADLVDDVIVQQILSGVVEAATRTNILNFKRTT